MHLRSNTALEELRYYIGSTNKKILFITGAGLSVASGVPLYRNDNQQDDEEKSGFRIKLRKAPTPARDPFFPININYGSLSSTRASSAKDKYSDMELQTPPSNSKEAPFRRKRLKVSKECHSSTNTPIWNRFIETQALRARFLEGPERWYKQFWNKSHDVKEFVEAKPNQGHKAIAELCKRFPERISVITQNVDGLHFKSGCDALEVHGRLGRFRCINPACEASYSKVLERQECLKRSNSVMPYCPLCKDVLMPLALLFDEIYESHLGFVWENAKQKMQEADVIVFVGTSLSVSCIFRALEYARPKNTPIFNVNIRRLDFSYERFDREAYEKHLRSRRPTSSASVDKDVGQKSHDSVLDIECETSCRSSNKYSSTLELKTPQKKSKNVYLYVKNENIHMKDDWEYTSMAHCSNGQQTERPSVIDQSLNCVKCRSVSKTVYTSFEDNGSLWNHPNKRSKHEDTNCRTVSSLLILSSRNESYDRDTFLEESISRADACSVEVAVSSENDQSRHGQSPDSAEMAGDVSFHSESLDSPSPSDIPTIVSLTPTKPSTLTATLPGSNRTSDDDIATNHCQVPTYRNSKRRIRLRISSITPELQSIDLDSDYNRAESSILSNFFVSELYPISLVRHLIGTTDTILPLLLECPQATIFKEIDFGTQEAGYSVLNYTEVENEREIPCPSSTK